MGPEKPRIQTMQTANRARRGRIRAERGRTRAFRVQSVNTRMRLARKRVSSAPLTPLPSSAEHSAWSTVCASRICTKTIRITTRSAPSVRGTRTRGLVVRACSALRMLGGRGRTGARGKAASVSTDIAGTASTGSAFAGLTGPRAFRKSWSFLWQWPR